MLNFFGVQAQKPFSHSKFKALKTFGIGIFFCIGCTSTYLQSIGENQNPVIQQTYLTDYSTAWNATLEALKGMPLEVTNLEGGYIQTRWKDNTLEKNYVHSFVSSDNYAKAQFRFRISLGKKYHQGSPMVKISVQKEQLVQKDVLEGWKAVKSDTFDENTLLYRIGRLIFMIAELYKQQQEMIKNAIKTPAAP